MAAIGLLASSAAPARATEQAQSLAAEV